jgi:hypothetical protein
VPDDEDVSDASGPDAATALLAKRLRRQSRACLQLGSDLYASLLARAVEDVESGGPTWELLRGHEHDPAGSALALRTMGAVNRLVLEGRLPDLARLYGDPEASRDEVWDAFRQALATNLDALRRLVDLPVQTNEVGRCAALLPGFLAVADRTGLPLRLLELGSSAGLNLRWDRYRYEADGFSWGSPDSRLKIGFELVGTLPADTPAVVAERRGCDPAPLDPASEQGRLALLSYVWADQPHRAERMLAALALAAETPAEVEHGSAAGWVGERLAEPAPGLATVVFHSIVMQYLEEAERDALATLMREAGEAASAAAPLAWLRMEPAGERADVRLTTWPGGEERHLARVGYHGNPVELM